MNGDAIRGHLDLILLASLEGGPLYGVRLIQDIETRTQGAFRFKEGTIYPALHRLEKAGLITAEMRPSDIGGPPRKYYQLTERGRTDLARRQQEWRQFSSAMRPFGGEA